MTPDFTKDNKPYRIEVDSDARNMYEYWIEHASSNITEEQDEKQRKIFQEVFTVLNKYLFI